ncbi:hypothetical protein F1559_005175 [Cyanidiococcus yangmingshanensis]|uniref:Uncharacterized protein n=1 Tax=Cyanidiococcus yangmingshanensis TaxID=2690220 RepID=A0A7J7IDZ1_9RHOD|nr:hypothetical protein F1559_005175 [Cyanidiococcus yangmingshanensis]
MTLTTHLCTPITRTIRSTMSKHRLASKTEDTREAFATWHGHARRCPGEASPSPSAAPGLENAGWPIRRRAASMASGAPACTRPRCMCATYACALPIRAGDVGRRARSGSPSADTCPSCMVDALASGDEALAMRVLEESARTRSTCSHGSIAG